MNLCKTGSVKGKYLKALVYFSVFAGAPVHAGTNYTVNSFADTNTGSGTSGTLRYCINQANNAGGAGSTITFGSAGTLTLVNSLPPIGPNIASISSNSNAVVINGSSTFGAFYFAPLTSLPGTAVTINNNFQVMNAASIGGNGGIGISDGGGGALGAGGGLFVADYCNVSISGSSMFSGCFARGGAGGNSGNTIDSGSGGGGGMNGGTGGSAVITGLAVQAGGGGGGFGGAGGTTNEAGGGGGGGLFFSGGGSMNIGGGGGGSDANNGVTATDSGGNGGAGGTGTSGTAGAGGVGESTSSTINGGNGTGSSGGGGGGGITNMPTPGGTGGNSALGAGGGGTSYEGVSGNGGTSTGQFGGGGGGAAFGSSGHAGNGGNGSYAGGGGAAGAGYSGSTIVGGVGGNGGFGGGGGGASGTSIVDPGNVGNGGFGGGGGGGYFASTSGISPFGGGNGATGQTLFGVGGGGGGGALGGTIFVSQGAVLSIQDPFQTSITSGTSTGGAGGTNAGPSASGSPGQALGPDIFLMSSGTIIFNQSTQFTVANPIAGNNGVGGGITTTGGIVMSGSGTLTLGNSTTASTYSGSTTLMGSGILQVANDTNLGIATNLLILNGGNYFEFTASTTLNSSRPVQLVGSQTIQVDTGVTAEIAGVVSGLGASLTVTTPSGTPGNLYLSNASNSYNMGTTVSNGANLQISNNGSLGSGTLTLNSGSLELLPAFQNATLTNSIVVNAIRATITQDTASFFTPYPTLSGSITMNGALTISQLSAGSILNLSGALSGTSTGLVMAGPGTLILSNTGNSQMGTTFTGGTVQISSTGNVGSGGSLNFNGGTLELLNGIGSPTFANAINNSLSGGTIKTDTGVGAAVFAGNFGGPGGLLMTTIDGTSVQLSGTIGAANGIQNNGPGTLILSGTNTYAGVTNLFGGTIQINTAASLSGASNLVFKGGTLDLQSGVGSPTFTNAITMDASGGTIKTESGAGAVVFSSNIGSPGGLLMTTINGTSIELSGNITHDNGIQNNGPNMLILSGSNSYSGPTNVLGGPVQINSVGGLSSTSLVTLTNNLIFNASVTYSGRMGGVGSVTVNGGETVTLSGTNTYSGGTTIDSTGSLIIHVPSALPAAGNVLDNGQLFFNYGDTGTVSGQVTGTGSLTMSGSGVVNLTNAANSYSGGTNLNSGTIAVSKDPELGNTASPLIFNGGTLHIVQEPFAVFFSARPLTFNSPGGTVKVDNNTITVFSGGSSGVGGLTTVGPGVLFLSGMNSYAGNTTVQSGTLILEGGATLTNSSVTVQSSGSFFADGTVTDPITVNAGGTLGGTGTIGTATVDGTITGGVNNVGTLSGTTFNLNADSNYTVYVSDTQSGELVAGTSAVIDGGDLTLSLTNFTTAHANSYTVISGPITKNAPFTLINPYPRYPFSLLYTPNSVLLEFNGTPIPFHVLIPSGNAGAVASCFDVLDAMMPSDLTGVISILNVQTPSEIEHSLNQMQPANFNNVAFAEENVAERIRQIYTAHFFEQGTVSCPEEHGWRLWAAPFVERVRQHGTSQNPGYLERFSGFSTALDYSLEKHWMFTGGFSYASTELNVPNGRAKASFKTYAGTLGAAWTDLSFFADALFSYLFSPIDEKRKMHFAVTSVALTSVVDLSASHHDSSNQVLGHLGGGYNYKIKATQSSTYNIYPFANLDYIYIPQDSYTEHGAGSLDLKVHEKSYDLLRPEGGLGIGYKGCFKHVEALLDLSVSYIHEFRFLGKNTTSKFKPASCTFTVKGLKPDNNLVSPTARLRLTSPVNGFSLMLGYHGEYGEHFIMNAGEAELRKAF